MRYRYAINFMEAVLAAPMNESATQLPSPALANFLEETDIVMAHAPFPDFVYIPVVAGEEVMHIIDLQNGVITVERGAEGTTATSHDAGELVTHGPLSMDVMGTSNLEMGVEPGSGTTELNIFFSDGDLKWVNVTKDFTFMMVPNEARSASPLLDDIIMGNRSTRCRVLFSQDGVGGHNVSPHPVGVMFADGNAIDTGPGSFTLTEFFTLVEGTVLGYVVATWDAGQ